MVYFGGMNKTEELHQRAHRFLMHLPELLDNSTTRGAYYLQGIIAEAKQIREEFPSLLQKRRGTRVASAANE